MIRKRFNPFLWLKRLKITKREWIFGSFSAILLLLLGLNYFVHDGNPSKSDGGLNAAMADPPLNVSNTESKAADQPAKTIAAPKVIKKQLVVDVKGSVKSPGVYKMAEGTRVVDAVKKAGGFTGNADQTLINLAKRLEDEMVIYVPKKGEKPSDIPGIAQSTVNSGDQSSQKENVKIAVNTANETELEALPGVGPATAKAIIDYRKKHGRFKNANDLTNVPGIGEKTMNSFKDMIRF